MNHGLGSGVKVSGLGCEELRAWSCLGVVDPTREEPELLVRGWMV